MKSTVSITVVKDNDPQKALAGQTYARRGGIETILSIPRIDDDGESQVKNQKAKVKEEVVTKPKEEETNEMIDEVFPSTTVKPTDKISIDQRNKFIVHVKDNGVSVEAATKLLKLHKFETSACITVSALPFLTKEVSEMGGVGR